MARRSPVTQDAVNEACNRLQSENKSITVNAVITLTGGSFSTVGPWVKAWRETHTAPLASAIPLPENVTQAMRKAVSDLWASASALATERVTNAEQDLKDARERFNTELAEYATEVKRLERELKRAQQSTQKSKTLLSESRAKTAALQLKNATLEARINDRTEELERLREAYDKLQAELLNIAKAT